MAAVKLARVSEVHFLLPVEVGNLLEISSRPVFTGDDGAVIVVTECKVGNSHVYCAILEGVFLVDETKEYIYLNVSILNAHVRYTLQVKDHRATRGFRSTNRMVYEFTTDAGFEFPWLQPRSYAGMLGWLEGRRHWHQSRGLPLE